MKTCREVIITFFYLVLLLLVAMAYPASIAQGELLQENSSKWPSMVINPPEFEAFFRVLDEKTKGVYILPKTKNDPRVVLIEPELHIVLDAEGNLAGLSISILVTKRVKNRYVYRQFRYHNIWVRGLEYIFYSTLFLNRTLEENKKLAFSDEKAYWDRVEESIPNVKREAVEDALITCRGFATLLASGSPVVVPAHVALNAFAACVDTVFRQAFEPYLGFDIDQFFSERLILEFDYEPWQEERFLLKITAIILTPTPSGIIFPLFSRERLIAETSSMRSCSGASELAKQAFRAMLALHDEIKK